MDVKKRVLYITYDGLTDPLGQSQILPYIIGLSGDYDFTILSCEKKERFAKFSGKIQKICQQHGIVWERIFFKTKPPILAKYIDLYELKRKAISLQKQKNFQLVHCRSYISIEIGLLLKKRFGVKVLFDMRGFWVDERVEGGLWNLKNPIYRLAYKMYKKKEDFFIHNSDHIVSLTEVGKKEIESWSSYKETTPITIVPCMVDFSVFSSSGLSKANAKQKLGLDTDNFVVSYLGSLGTWYLLDEMLSFFKTIKEFYKKALFLIITPDPPEHIIEKAVLIGLSSEDFKIFFSPREEVPEKIKASDISLVFIKKCYSKKASSPTKLGELMAMGIPVVCNEGVGDVDAIINRSKGGLLLQDFSLASFKNVIQQFPEVLDLTSTEITDSIKPYYDLNKGVISYKDIYRSLIG